MALLALAVIGAWRAAAVPLALAFLLSCALAFPLTLGITVFVAWLPALLIAFAAREARVAGTLPMRVAGGIVVAAVGALFVAGLVASRDIGLVVWSVGAVFQVGIAAAGIVCVLPLKASGTRPRAR